MKNISKTTSYLILASFLLSACATQNFNLREGGARTPTQTKLQIFFISGIGQTEQIDAAAICRSASNVVAIKFQQSFLDFLIVGISQGLITPRTAKVYCK
jgi:hypothetical protein